MLAGNVHILALRAVQHTNGFACFAYLAKLVPNRYSKKRTVGNGSIFKACKWGCIAEQDYVPMYTICDTNKWSDELQGIRMLVEMG